VFSLGVLSLIQITFLPGFLALRLFRITDAAHYFFLSFPLSVLLNHITVLFLSSIGQYNRLSYSIIVLLEVFAIAISFIRGTPISTTELQTKVSAGLRQLFSTQSLKWQTYGLLCFSLGLSALAKVSINWSKELGTIFTEWDSILSWNRWAVDWSHSIWPPVSDFYPQALPTLYSISYIFMGSSEIQFFPKFFSGMYPVMAVATFIYLGFSFPRKISLFFLGAFFYWYTADASIKGLLYSGYADGPISYFIAPILLCLLFGQRSQKDQKIFFPILGMVIASATLTKQGGWFYAIIVPILYFVPLLENNDFGPDYVKHKKFRTLIPIFLFVTIFCAPWYVHQIKQFFLGLDTPNTAKLSEMGGPAGIAKITGVLVTMHTRYLFFSLLPVGLLFRKDFRILTLVLALPYTLIWAGTFAYDARNLAPAYGALGFAYASGFEAIGHFFLHLDYHSRRIKIGMSIATALLLLFAIGYGQHLFPNETLIIKNLEARKRIVYSKLNENLYQTFNSSTPDGKIVGAYQIIEYLPGFENSHEYLICEGLDYVKSTVRRVSAKYFLIFMCRNDVIDFWEDQVKAGKAQEVFRMEKFLFDGTDVTLLRLNTAGGDW